MHLAFHPGLTHKDIAIRFTLKTRLCSSPWGLCYRKLVWGSTAWLRTAPSGLVVFVACVRWLILLDSLVDVNLTIRTLNGLAYHVT